MPSPYPASIILLLSGIIVFVCVLVPTMYHCNVFLFANDTKDRYEMPTPKDTKQISPIDKIKDGLATLLPDEGDKSSKQRIEEMISEITSALDRGVTYEMIATYLKGHGLDLRLNTLRQYVAAAKKKAEEATRAKANKLTPRPKATPTATPSKPKTDTTATTRATAAKSKANKPLDKTATTTPPKPMNVVRVSDEDL